MQTKLLLMKVKITLLIFFWGGGGGGGGRVRIYDAYFSQETFQISSASEHGICCRHFQHRAVHPNHDNFVDIMKMLLLLKKVLTHHVEEQHPNRTPPLSQQRML